MRRDIVFVLFIAAAAFGIRTYPVWNTVFSDEGVNFLETDAWYHVRLTENQVRNYPWRVTFDPFAAPAGQFVPIAPLFDTLTSTAVVVIFGRNPQVERIERVAALMPPIYGTLTVVAVWALGRRLFDRRAGLIAAALLTVLPGHFMDRTMLGFVDHHALEALLAVCVLLAFSRALQSISRTDAVVTGVALGSYLLAWGSGALLVAVVGAWLVASVVVRPTGDGLRAASTATLVAAAVALMLVLAFQDPAMHRYATQIFGLIGLALIALVIRGAMFWPGVLGPRPATLGLLAVVGTVAAAVVTTVGGDLMRQVIVDVVRLAPDPSRMGVLEARPLFLYTGRWSWEQPWAFFRTGFFVGAVALLPFAIRVWRQRHAADLLILIFALAMFIATVGQNRFGYYLVTACAILGGWLAMTLLDWGGVPHAANRAPRPHTTFPLAREIAVIAVAGVMFAPNLAPRVLFQERTATLPDYWRKTMQWVRENTPAPFSRDANGPEYYLVRYADSAILSPTYSVMSWWDQGYWVTQLARRVPVANPTQGGAGTAARFYSATNEADARDILRAERVGYVLSDFELPFRILADGTIMGRFQTILDWTDLVHDRFYEIAYRRQAGDWVPVWIFHEAYYRSMAFRLSVAGGAAVTPDNSTSLVTVVARVDDHGMTFRELVAEETFATHEDAQRALQSRPGAAIVGLDPWRSAFPIEALHTIVPIHAARTSGQQPSETPWVRVFDVR